MVFVPISVFNVRTSRIVKKPVFAMVSAVASAGVYQSRKIFGTVQTVAPQWFELFCTDCTNNFIFSLRKLDFLRN